MPESENKSIVQRFIDEVLNQGKLETADEIVAENFVELDPLPGQKQGREGLKEIVAMLRTAFPDMHWSIDETIASGEKVVTRFTWTGTHKAEFLGIRATGKMRERKGRRHRSHRRRQDDRQPHPDGQSGDDAATRRHSSTGVSAPLPLRLETGSGPSVPIKSKPAAKSTGTKKSAASRALYLYAISQMPKTAAPVIAAEGIDGASPVEALRCGNYLCWVSRVPRHEFADTLSDRMQDLEWLATTGLRHQRAVAEISAS